MLGWISPTIKFFVISYLTIRFLKFLFILVKSLCIHCLTPIHNLDYLKDSWTGKPNSSHEKTSAISNMKVLYVQINFAWLKIKHSFHKSKSSQDHIVWKWNLKMKRLQFISVVTGGTDGIGLAYLTELAQSRGLKKFYLVGRSEKKLQSVAASLSKFSNDFLQLENVALIKFQKKNIRLKFDIQCLILRVPIIQRWVMNWRISM